MITVRVEDFEMTSGAEQVVTYDAPILYRAPTYRTYRCSTCGSPVPPSSTSDELLEIPAGLFDDDPGLRPDKHIFTDFIPEWDQITDSLPQYDVRSLIEYRTGTTLSNDFVVRSHRVENSDDS